MSKVNHNQKILQYLSTFIIIALLLYAAININPAKNPKSANPVNSANREQAVSFKDLLSKKKVTTAVASKTTTLIFTGDVIPARSTNTAMRNRNSFTYPFEKTADFLKDADLTIINLEAPLITNCPSVDSGMTFCGDPRFIEGLLYGGVDIAGLANNHIGNYGSEGIQETIRVLKNSNIEPVGTHNIVYKELNGTKFAFIALNGIVPFITDIDTIEKQTIAKLTQEADTNANIVVALFHWGKEYSPVPLPDGGIAPENPVEIGRFAIDNGADLVIGNHPHVVQGYEIYKGKPIFYALGNFIFDQMWSSETRIGAVLIINFRGSQVESFSLHPVRIDDYAQPQFLEGEEKAKVLEKMQLVNQDKNLLQ